ncbi:hypothetical protein HKD37_13G035403 [Glycine soja]
MTLTIPQLFLKPLQVMWDATVFRIIVNYLTYCFKFIHNLLCVNNNRHRTKTSLRAGNSDLHEEQDAEFKTGCVPRSLPEWENLVIWFCSLHNRPGNYFKGIINNALKGLDDTPQPKSKASARRIVVKCNRQKGSTECGYYMIHWMSTIILENFKNNWETISIMLDHWNKRD